MRCVRLQYRADGSYVATGRVPLARSNGIWELAERAV